MVAAFAARQAHSVHEAAWSSLSTPRRQRLSVGYGGPPPWSPFDLPLPVVSFHLTLNLRLQLEYSPQYFTSTGPRRSLNHRLDCCFSRALTRKACQLCRRFWRDGSAMSEHGHHLIFDAHSLRENCVVPAHF